jgi:hypothetical protein
MDKEILPQSSLILYQTEDGRTRIKCRFESETLWLTQAQMAELFQTTPQNVTLHLKAIFAEGELVEAATCKQYLQVRFEGGREVSRKLRHYSLEAILAVGYRVRSHRGTQFRQWATARLTEYLVKGFTMDDEQLKNSPGKGQKDYFDELLERIRDIRSSERRFYQKILDIYATSIDYSPDTEASHRFFATVQNTAMRDSAFLSAKPFRRARLGGITCTGPRMGTRLQRSSRSVRMPQSPSWACKRPAPVAWCAKTMWASPRTTSPKASFRC